MRENTWTWTSWMQKVVQAIVRLTRDQTPKPFQSENLVDIAQFLSKFAQAKEEEDEE